MAPCAANLLAIAAPMPRAPPVTTTRAPTKRPPTGVELVPVRTMVAPPYVARRDRLTPFVLMLGFVDADAALPDQSPRRTVGDRLAHGGRPDRREIRRGTGGDRDRR